MTRKPHHFDEPPPEAISKRKQPQHKHVWATLNGKDEALQRLERQLNRRDGSHIQQRVALCDGDEALQSRLQAMFPHFTLVLDFIHAYEYLCDAANTLFENDTPDFDQWIQTHTRQLLSSQTQRLVDALKQQAQQAAKSAQQVALNKAANYLNRNRSFIDYKMYLENGWPIASGVIEGACRHLVKDRMELSGMRWTQPHAEAMLQLRAVAENDDWDAYHHFRRQCQQRRLYHPTKSASFVPTLYHQLPLGV